jgi:UDP-N-acetylmuramoyl-tripeptide--D-alanyl-D-alanine ligase
MKFDLRDVAAGLGIRGEFEGVATGWSVDTRTLQPGDVFFALRGPCHDGHEYVRAAFEKGAVASVVEQGYAAGKGTETNGQLLVAPDTLLALQNMAAWARDRWGGDVIGVTGSAGKTTTKDAIAAMLAVEMQVGKTVGNYNNHVGVPLSLLRLPDKARAAVIEMGMNHAGEIRALARIARPDAGVVTNVGYAHIENFDSIDGIAAAKRELIDALPSNGVAVLNADDTRVAAFRGGHEARGGRCVTFGLSEGADVRAEDVELSFEGSRFRVGAARFESALAGRPGVLNVLAGIAVAGVYGIAPERLRDAVRSLRPGKMRGECFTHNGILIYNDSYNSNPEAVRAMLDVLRDAPARRKIAVLGEMLELGRWAEPLHRDIGRYVAAQGVAVLVGIRGVARHMVDAAMDAGLDVNAAFFFEQPEDAGVRLRELAREGDAILFKGSRGARVERALEVFLG